MPLTVLSDAEVRNLLLTLTRQDIEDLQGALGEALHSYSTGDTNSPCSASHQPRRTIIKKNGVTTLFMPASTGTSVGMKIVSLDQPDVPIRKQSSVTSPKGSIAGSDGASPLKSVTSDLSSMTISPASTLASDETTSSSGGKGSIDGSNFQPPASIASSQSTTPKGSVTILDSKGNPMGIINAEELTAFRTALAATFLIRKRHHCHTVTIFGAGKQAYWHIRLALLLRGEDIKHVNIINRSFERSIRLMKAFQITDDSPDKGKWRKDVKFSTMSPEFGEYGRLLKEEVRKADVLFCCTPSTEPLFPAEFLTSREGQKKGRYISAIGSYAPHMCELHPDILKVAVQHDGRHHHHKHAKQGGVIIVDSLESSLKEAGEVIQAKLKPDQLVEIGELIMIKKAASKEVELGGEGEGGLWEWLTRGNVIYKSVGMGLMDLVVGGELIRFARERDLGVTIEDF